MAGKLTLFAVAKVIAGEATREAFLFTSLEDARAHVLGSLAPSGAKVREQRWRTEIWFGLDGSDPSDWSAAAYPVSMAALAGMAAGRLH